MPIRHAISRTIHLPTLLQDRAARETSTQIFVVKFDGVQIRLPPGSPADGNGVCKCPCCNSQREEDRKQQQGLPGESWQIRLVETWIQTKVCYRIYRLSMSGLGCGSSSSLDHMGRLDLFAL